MLKQLYALHNNNCALKTSAIVTAPGRSTSELSVCITQHFHRSIFKKKVTRNIKRNFLFHTFAVFWMFLSFRAISWRLNYTCRLFGTFSLFHLHRWCPNNLIMFVLSATPSMNMEQSVPNVGIENSDGGNIQKKE